MPLTRSARAPRAYLKALLRSCTLLKRGVYMTQENYVEYVLSSLSLQTREDLQSHLSHLDEILEQIDKVPSPEKEALLVELILRGPEKPVHHEAAQPSV